MILSSSVTSQLHFEMCAGHYGHPVYAATGKLSARMPIVLPMQKQNKLFGVVNEKTQLKLIYK